MNINHKLSTANSPPLSVVAFSFCGQLHVTTPVSPASSALWQPLLFLTVKIARDSQRVRILLQAVQCSSFVQIVRVFPAEQTQKTHFKKIPIEIWHSHKSAVALQA